MRDCCKDQSKRKEVSRSESTSVQKCGVCGALHYEMILDPGKYGIRMSGGKG